MLCLAKLSETDDSTDAIKQRSVITMEKWLLARQQERGTRWAASGATRDVHLTSRSASLFWEGRACICLQLAQHTSSSSLGQLDHLLPMGEGDKPLLLAGRAIT